MGAILRILAGIFRFLTWPFRAIVRVLFGGGRAANTARKAVGSAAATDDGVPEPAEEDPLRAVVQFPFKAIDRPRLAEQSATELTLEIAEGFVQRADRFYSNEFDLFPQGSLFYEEVELEELSYALAYDDPNSSDAGFVKWMNAFRRTLNDNARRLLMVYAPLVFAVVMGLGTAMITMWPRMEDIPGLALGAGPSTWVIMPGLTVIALMVLVLLYQWPFKVIIQRNLLGLDNYITSRFSRINQNFQVAKRFALNVERNKRMSQAEELKREAGVWTVAYNWFAMRLFLCERVVRNQMYQVNRNATLYGLGGMTLSLIITAIAFVVWRSLGTPAVTSELLTFAGCGLAYVLVAYTLVVGGAAGEARRVLRDNEWFRFGAADLDSTIADHVGEDKLQIVTFRDRNRIE